MTTDELRKVLKQADQTWREIHPEIMDGGLVAILRTTFLDLIKVQLQTLDRLDEIEAAQDKPDGRGRPDTSTAAENR